MEDKFSKLAKVRFGETLKIIAFPLENLIFSFAVFLFIVESPTSTSSMLYAGIWSALGP